MAKKVGNETKGILSRQRPRRRKWVAGRFVRTIKFGAVFIAIALISIFGSRIGAKYSKNWRLTKTVPEVINVQIKPAEGFSLTPVDASRIRDTVNNSISDSGSLQLEQIAKSLHNGSDFERIHVFHAEPNQIIVSLKKRVPLLAIMVDRMRFLTREAVVYGEVHDNQSPLVRLNGVFSTRKAESFEMNQDNSLATTVVEKGILAEAVELIDLTEINGIGVSFIDFQEYRGFILHLVSNEVEVAIGRAPFAARFRRLASTMDQLKKNGILYSRIELDYDGKAFIKEKKL